MPNDSNQQKFPRPGKIGKNPERKFAAMLVTEPRGAKMGNIQVRFLTIFFLVLLYPACVRACLRDQIDERAVQWSSQIVEAKLVEVSERIEMKAVTVKPKAGSNAGELTAVYYYRVYSFEVEKVIESAGHPAKPKYRIEVLRFFGKVDHPNSTAAAPAAAPPACGEQLNRNALGHSFVLLLRHEQDIKMERPPVWTDMKNPDPRDAEVHGTRAYAAIYLMPRDKATEGDIANLRKVIGQTRAAERKVSDQEIHKWIDGIIHAANDKQAEPAIAALRAAGYKAVSHLKSARDRRGTLPAAKERLAKLAIELSPPPLSIIVGEHVE
jgi:hypothetical protein